MADIVLIGVAHDDLKGKERLSRALEIEKPDIITLETTIDMMNNFKESYDILVDNLLNILKEKNVNETTYSLFEEILDISEPFEHSVCKDYARKNNTKFYIIDHPESSAKARDNIKSGLTQFVEQADKNFLEAITKESINEDNDKMYKHIQDLFDAKVPNIGEEEKIINLCRESMYLKERDLNQASNIRRLTKENDCKIVHVGGTLHMMDDSLGQSLYSRIKDLNPKRKTLLEYASPTSEIAKLFDSIYKFYK